MNDDIDNPRIDAAIKSYPLADLPPDLVATTIRQIRPRPAAQKFSLPLNFLDAAIPAFSAGFSLTLLFTARWLFRTIDPWQIERLRLELSWFYLTLTPAKTAAISALMVFSLVCVLAVFMTAVHFSSAPPVRSAR